jgi:hypothetical protein
MPLTHLICPIDGKLRTLAEERECARRWKRREDREGRWRHCDYPYAYINALSKEGEKRKGVGISVTQIAHCWRQSWAESRIDYASYPKRRWGSHHGTAVHEYLEKYMDLPPEELRAEDRYWKNVTLLTEVEGHELSGAIDNWWPELGIVADFKIIQLIMDSDQFTDDLIEKYRLQLQIYQWMLETGCEIRQEDGTIIQIKAPKPITKLILYPIDHKDFKIVEVPLADFAEIAALVRDGVRGMSATEMAEVPRQYVDPATTSFCKHVCVFQQHCLNAGGKVMGK